MGQDEVTAIGIHPDDTDPRLDAVEADAKTRAVTDQYRFRKQTTHDDLVVVNLTVTGTVDLSGATVTEPTRSYAFLSDDGTATLTDTAETQVAISADSLSATSDFAILTTGADPRLVYSGAAHVFELIYVLEFTSAAGATDDTVARSKVKKNSGPAVTVATAYGSVIHGAVGDYSVPPAVSLVSLAPGDILRFYGTQTSGAAGQLAGKSAISLKRID